MKVVQARLASIENRRKVKDVKDDSKPTLRRTSTDKPKDGDNKDGTKGGTSDDDERPTLKRRPS